LKPPSLFFFAAAALLLSACVGGIYVPSFSNKPHSGQPLTARDVSFIVVGQTTRAQVVKKLGDGFRDSPRVAAMAYPWEMPAGWGAVWFVTPNGGGGGSGAEFTRWRALFLTFDARGVVARKEFVRLKGKLTLDEQLESWAGWVPPHTPAEILP
jgi:hypothetical protein